MNLKKFLVILSHADVGWALCAATMGIGTAVTTLQTALIVHAIGAPIDKGCGNVTHVRDGKIIFDGLLPAEQIWIVQEYYEAVNAGNIDAAMAFVAEDVKCRGTCYLSGKESFQFFIQGLTNGGGRTEISDLVVDGDKVTHNWTGYNQNGAVVGGGVDVVQIKDGKIVLMEGDLN